MSTLSDLEDFFQAEEGTGEEVSTQIARITEKALCGPKSKKDDEKLHELKQKRSKNIQVLELKNFFRDSCMLLILLTPHIFHCYIIKNHSLYNKYFNTSRLDGFSFKRSSWARAGC